MQGTVLRSQLRTNVPGHTAVVGEVTYASGIPAVASGTRFTVGRGVLSLTLASSPTIASAPDGTYTNVPVTTASGSTALCSLTVSGASGVISAATVTAPGYDYTAAATMSVAVGSLFWTASSLATGLTGLTAGTYYVALSKTANIGAGMIAKVVVSTTAVTAVTVNPTTDSSTALGANYGTSAITFDLPVGALYSGSPAIPSAFVLTPNAGITGAGASITTVITGNCSVIFANRVQSVIGAVATVMSTVGNTAFCVVKRFGGPVYVNFGTLKNVTTGTPNTADLTWSSATPSNGDGFSFEIVATDTAVTA